MKFYITTPIYYVNDKPHIGSAYPTVAADVLARYHRLRGDEVFFLTGTDEHGQKVARSAAASNQTPQAYCDEYAATFELAWDILDISHDDFIRTTSDRHKAGLKAFLTRLKEAGAIYEGEYQGLYCTGCEKFMTEKELVDGQCPDHKCAPELVKEKNYFFNLKKYLPQVEELIVSGQMKILPESKKKEVLGLFKQGLEDFSLSRESVKWGVTLPFDQSQVAYVWVDALTNYITALGYGQSDETKLQKFWPADIHLIGKDIIKFHAVYWPAMLVAAGLSAPQTIFAHGFFTIDGEKMSKSLGNVIDPADLAKELGTDATRYLLLSQFPFGADGDIKFGEFAIQYNADLANGIGNFVSRVLAMAEKYLAGVVPERDDFLQSATAEIWQKYQTALDNFAVDQAISAIKQLNALGDSYVEQQKPWVLAKSDEPALAKTLYNLLEAVRQLGVMLYPVMPETADKILTALGQSHWQSRPLKELQEWGGLEPGVKVAKIEALFPRLEK